MKVPRFGIMVVSRKDAMDKFYKEVSELYDRAKHGAISGDDFCYEVGCLLDKYTNDYWTCKNCGDKEIPPTVKVCGICGTPR